MKTNDIIFALTNNYVDNQKVVIENLTDQSGLVRFETDLLILSASGYASGFEIKVSASDLKADLKKKHIKRLTNGWKANWLVTGHYSALEYFFKSRFKYFSYAVPSKLVDKALKQIPEWCGLYSIIEGKYGYPVPIEVRKPKKLGNEPWTEGQRKNLYRLVAIRYRNAIIYKTNEVGNRRAGKNN